MSTFLLIHGAGDVGWSWHLVANELRARGHEVFAPDLPGGDDSLTLDDCVNAVVRAFGDRREAIVVAHSFGGFLAPLIAARMSVKEVIYVTAMVPRPGEAPKDWPRNTGFVGPESEDPYEIFYNGVPQAIAREAVERTRDRRFPSEVASEQPWPLAVMPAVPTRFILCTEDRFFPADFMRKVVEERLGIEAEEIAGGHGVALGRPVELANRLSSPRGEREFKAG